MDSYRHECMGNYNFENIARHAKKRFIDGFSTIELLQQATSIEEKEEIVLVSMLDVKDDLVGSIRLSCRYASDCKISNCRSLLKEMIEEELGH